MTVTPYSAETAPPAGPRVKFTGCYTSQGGCAGVAYFRNPTRQYASYSIWFNNGANGVSNFVLKLGGSHGIHAQTGDAYSSAWGNRGVPHDAPRD